MVVIYTVCLFQSRSSVNYILLYHNSSFVPTRTTLPDKQIFLTVNFPGSCHKTLKARTLVHTHTHTHLPFISSQRKSSTLPHVQVSAETDSVCSCFLLFQPRCHGNRASLLRHTAPPPCHHWVIQPISWIVSSSRWSFQFGFVFQLDSS